MECSAVHCVWTFNDVNSPRMWHVTRCSPKSAPVQCPKTCQVITYAFAVSYANMHMSPTPSGSASCHGNVCVANTTDQFQCNTSCATFSLHLAPRALVCISNRQRFARVPPRTMCFCKHLGLAVSCCAHVTALTGPLPRIMQLANRQRAHCSQCIICATMAPALERSCTLPLERRPCCCS